MKAKVDEKAEALAKKEEARLEVLSEEAARKEGITRERAKEAKVVKLVELRARQTELDGLLNQLHLEGINSISDLENKLAKASQDVEAEVSRVV